MDASLDPRLEFSEWLHHELVAAYARETETWALERVARVMQRLNAQRPDGHPVAAEVLWVSDLTAFTTAGRYIYISRRLLERLPTDDAAAFVLAHEVAHHDCRHLSLFEGWADWLPRSRNAAYLAALIRLLEHRAYGPEREDQADAYAVDLCLDAGYDGDLVIQALEILENEVLDRGDYDGVFGPENLLDPADPRADSPMYQLQRWVWTRTRGYLPIRERRERARTWLALRSTRRP